MLLDHLDLNLEVSAPRRKPFDPSSQSGRRGVRLAAVWCGGKEILGLRRGAAEL